MRRLRPFSAISTRHSSRESTIAGRTLDLPLNAMLLKAAAEASARAALHIARKADTPTLQRAVFDLFAWTGPHAGKLDAAFDGLGSSLKDAPVVPVIPVDRCHWSSLSGVHVWPAGRFSLMKALEGREASRRAARVDGG